MRTQSLASPLKTPRREQAYLFTQNHDCFQVSDFTNIGRSESNQISIDNTCVSRRHFRIYKKNKTFFVEDTNSRNGTYLNGSRILHAELKEMDKVQFGNTHITFSYKKSLEKNTPHFSSKNEVWGAHLKQIPQMANSEFPVLILGPSGSGKEVISSYIHNLSPRAGGPFVCLNCSALNETLIESELFGHKKGSFTDAHENRKGAFEQARGGTLFLDEIGDLPLNLQPKLLRALENKEIRSIGAETSTKTDVRILCATHKDLRHMVMEKKFREDLFFRINILSLNIPSLSERLEDFEDIFYKICKKYKVAFSVPAIERMKIYPWPGNIRELQNIIAKASVLFQDKRVELDDLKELMNFSDPIILKDSGPKMSISTVEKNVIHATLLACKGNQRQACEKLGIPRSTLSDKITKYNISVDELRGYFL